MNSLYFLQIARISQIVFLTCSARAKNLCNGIAKKSVLSELSVSDSMTIKQMFYRVHILSITSLYLTQVQALY